MLLCMLVSWRLQQYSGVGGAGSALSAAQLYGAGSEELFYVLTSLPASLARTKIGCFPGALLGLVSYRLLAKF